MKLNLLYLPIIFTYYCVYFIIYVSVALFIGDKKANELDSYISSLTERLMKKTIFNVCLFFANIYLWYIVFIYTKPHFINYFYNVLNK